MERIVVGIDVSKDQLDVAIRPGGARFVVGRTVAGVDDLILQLTGQDVQLIALEATGGFETVVAATLGSRICRSSSSILRRSVPLPGLSASRPKPILSMQR